MDRDRDLENKVLNFLKMNEAKSFSPEYLPRDCQVKGLQSTLRYLHHHKLITGVEVDPWQDERRLIQVEITETGKDYLEPDGGLSTELNTITIRFDMEDLQECIAKGIAASQLSSEDQSSLIRFVKGASETALKALVAEVIKKGASYGPELLALYCKYA